MIEKGYFLQRARREAAGGQTGGGTTERSAAFRAPTARTAPHRQEQLGPLLEISSGLYAPIADTAPRRQEQLLVAKNFSDPA